MPEEELKSSNHPPAKKRRRFRVVVPVGVLAAVAILLWVGRGCEAAPESGPRRVKSTVHLETFVLNLADPGQRSYLRVGIDLGLNRELKHGEEVPVGRVRDAILDVLAEAKADELLSGAGKTRLRENLLHALEQRCPDLGVEEIYFTEFLIQR